MSPKIVTHYLKPAESEFRFYMFSVGFIFYS